MNYRQLIGLMAGAAGAGGGGGPSYEGSGSIAAGSGFSLVVTPPTHQTDDILVLQGINGSNGFFTASGWTLISDSDDLNIDHSWLWKRAASSGETATLAPSGFSGGMRGIVHCFRGCVATGTPFEDATVTDQNSGGTHPSTAAIDTAGANRLAVSMAGHFKNPPAYSPGSPPPSGWDAGMYGDSGSYAFTLIKKAVASATNVAAIQMGTVADGGPAWASLTLALIPA